MGSAGHECEEAEEEDGSEIIELCNETKRACQDWWGEFKAYETYFESESDIKHEKAWERI